jgi:hypothetical protein
MERKQWREKKKRETKEVEEGKGEAVERQKNNETHRSGEKWVDE